ncbi:hypothetical protein Pst134EA_017431 [Puccinia striiformis f. sp. tritici]|uniref:hypothetical protein n=1 Tax=Puccinia striiformis f. sp. tritici TaxID=168172 RepID=UPI0020084CD1|nr:hypothetical protein Pst134EA_017431 [Puccinia striiformis f. sp. tritici]KAH9461121.1 hypothetical protein Pst134EA_017431 [Puccinia striiformis f. sp. tritici]KAI9607373.1 hypothetical protein H4Q26_005892 [Puccinia striiformis f. sp. tritici PST-130]
MVGLYDLPLELKRMIVEWATQIDTSHYSRVSGDRKISLLLNGAAPRGSCTRTISQVDRTFFGICRPILWKILDLRKIPTAALSDFHGAETLTTRYLQAFVREIKTEVMILRQPFGEDIQEPEFERFAHMEKILHETDPARIYTLKVELVLIGRFLEGYLPTCSHPLTARLLSTLSRLKNVKHFQIVSPASLSVPQNMLVYTVINMKTLTSFSAENIGYEEPMTQTERLETLARAQEGENDSQLQQPTPRSLVEFLPELKCLKSLRMYNSLCVDHRWSEASWQSPLTGLVVRRCPNLSSIAMQRFLKKFYLSLEKMDVSIIGISEMEQIQTNSSGYTWEIIQHETLISFKKLSSIKLVGINMGEHFLKSFQDSPGLRKVEIDSPNIRVQTLFELLRKWPLLRKINCRVRGGQGSLDLILYCFTHKIVLDECFYPAVS